MYKDMAAILNDKECGRFKINHFDIKENTFSTIRAGIPVGRYVRLTESGKCVMSDTPMEKRTNAAFCVHAHGDVLIGGLGIGMIILAIQDKPEVRSILVVEKNQEVIDMVAPQLPLNDKVKIVCSDVFEWKPAPKQRFDCIYMDIWSFINSDIYKEEMVPLKKRFGHYLKSKESSPDRFNMCWAEWNAKNEVELR